MKLLILGDCHGDFRWLGGKIEQARDLYGIDGVIQVGDFGFYPQTANLLRAFLKELAVPMWVIDGNHEDHEWMREMASGLAKSGLTIQPRGSLLFLDGAAIGFLGGALNADRPQECNVIAEWQVREMADRMNSIVVDLMVTHSCPAGIGVGMPGASWLIPYVEKYIVLPGFDVSRAFDVGEPMLTTLWYNLKRPPPHWVFGHFHSIHQKLVGDTIFTCVGRSDIAAHDDGSRGAVPWIYDTRAKTLVRHSERLR